jgi:hypothetical protein
VVVGVTQHLEFCWYPCPDRLVVINRPRRAHGNDRVEVRRVWELSLDVGRQVAVFPYYLMHNEVDAAVGQPLSDEAGSAHVIVLNQQAAHAAESNLGPNDWFIRVHLVGCR